MNGTPLMVGDKAIMCANNDKKYVFAITGPIGAGKTTTLSHIKKLGYTVIKENYMESDLFGIDNVFILSKWNWVSNWFNRTIHTFNTHDQVISIFSDRSPLEAGIWSKNCFLLLPALKHSFFELAQLGINCVHICLSCDLDILKNRIDNRLKKQPFRKKYKEDNLPFINELYHRYIEFSHLWDYNFDTGVNSPEIVANFIIDIVNKEPYKYA